MVRRPPSRTVPIVTSDDIRSSRFREKLRGYRPEEVDAALERWAQMVERNKPVAEDVKQTKFSQKLRGYHPVDVDAFVARLLTENR